MVRKYTVIRDSQEKKGKGWQFRASANCYGTEIKKIETGDYTLKGYENIFTIERKGRISEWAANMSQPRFTRELERLAQFKHPYILLEFDMKDLMKYPIGSGIPKKKWRYIKMKDSLLLKRTLEITVDYGIPIYFCGNFGQEVAVSLFKRIIEKNV